MPPNTTSLIQHLDQEIIATVKARYHSQVFHSLRGSTESLVEVRQILHGNEDDDIDEEELADVNEAPDFPSENPDLVTVHQFWCRFTVKDAVDNLMLAWESSSQDTLQQGWRHLTPHLCVGVGEESGDVASAALTDAVNAA